ncbi:MAG: ester cyclase [Chloroflexi bacterium]|nr:ester cyclase [Chloroflexota bacterium]
MLDLKDLTRRTWEEMLPAADFAALKEVIDPEAVNHDLPPGAPNGFEGVRQTIGMLHAAFSEQRYDVHHVIGEDDTVVIDATLHGRHTGTFLGIPPTNRQIALRSVHIVRYRDGREIETWALSDRLGLMQQLGVIPERPPAQRPAPVPA